MPPPAPASSTPPTRDPYIVDLTSLDDPKPRSLPAPGAKPQSTAEVPAGSPKEDPPTDGVPPILNGFLTWLNAAEEHRVGGSAKAFHLSMQLARCTIPSFPHDSLRRQWERLRASPTLTPTVTHAIPEFVKEHRDVDPKAVAVAQLPAAQAQRANEALGATGQWRLESFRPCPLSGWLQRAMDSYF